MFLLSLLATYQVWTVSLKAGLYTYKGSGADAQKPTLRCGFRARLTASVRLRWKEAGRHETEGDNHVV
jgi:hypothetical protein